MTAAQQIRWGVLAVAAVSVAMVFAGLGVASPVAWSVYAAVVVLWGAAVVVWNRARPGGNGSYWRWWIG